MMAEQAIASSGAPALLARFAIHTCLGRLRSKRWQFRRKRPMAEDEATILARAPSAGATPTPSEGLHSAAAALF